MWEIEVWVPPVRKPPERDQYGTILSLGDIIKPGFWEAKGTVETDEEAEEALRLAAKGYMVARATRDASEGIIGMRADSKSFVKWTGSGGSF